MDTQSANTSQQESAQPQGDQAEQGEQTQKQQEPNTKIGTFEPKYEVHIDPPKDEGYTAERLAEFDGTGADGRVFVAIKGTIFNVTGKDAYAPEGQYHVFAGKDASRALAQSSLKAEDVSPEWSDLSDEHKQVLEQWQTYFSKRYSIVGKVVQAQT